MIFIVLERVFLYLSDHANAFWTNKRDLFGADNAYIYL